MEELIHELSTIELQLPIEGALKPEMMFELAD